MKFEIPFSAEILTTQLELNFKLIWEKQLKSIKKYAIMSSVLLLFGLFMWFNDVPAGYFLIGMGILIGLMSLFPFAVYRKQKSKNIDNIKIEIEKNTESNESLIWEFTNEYLRFKDYKFDIRIKWFFFKNYRVIDGHLFMDQNKEQTAAMILSKEEIGEENFSKVLETVKEKIIIK